MPLSNITQQTRIHHYSTINLENIYIFAALISQIDCYQHKTLQKTFQERLFKKDLTRQSSQKRPGEIDLVKKTSVKRPQKRPQKTDLKKQTSPERPHIRDLAKEALQKDLSRETLLKRPRKRDLKKQTSNKRPLKTDFAKQT